jgi:hypothetical protein
MELQTVEVSLDKWTRDVEEMIASIRDDITANKGKFSLNCKRSKLLQSWEADRQSA